MPADFFEGTFSFSWRLFVFGFIVHDEGRIASSELPRLWDCFFVWIIWKFSLWCPPEAHRFLSTFLPISMRIKRSFSLSMIPFLKNLSPPSSFFWHFLEGLESQEWWVYIQRFRRLFFNMARWRRCPLGDPLSLLLRNHDIAHGNLILIFA